MGSVFFHVDMDAFYASIEQYENPDYRNKPIVIGTLEKRSVVSTCSYEARKYHIHSAMPAFQAYKLCPKAIFVKPRMYHYGKISKQIMEILSHYSPEVHQVSIDEAFLDMTGSFRLFGKPKHAALLIKKEVFNNTGLTISIGIASNCFIAKMASDYNKPDGLCLVSRGKEQVFIDLIGLKNLFGIGKSTWAFLEKKHLNSTQAVRQLSLEDLQKKVGTSLGNYLYKAVRGQDLGLFIRDTKNHSISSERTFYDDIYEEKQLFSCLLDLSVDLGFRAIEEKVLVKTISVKIRYQDFSTFTIQSTPNTAILNTKQIYDEAKKLLLSKWIKSKGVRLLGLSLSKTYKGETPIQGELFNEKEEKLRDVDKTIYSLTKKGIKIKKASSLTKDK
ncbi:MAG: DNA polymerase IV [Sphaerochaetaceae bacterium]